MLNLRSVKRKENKLNPIGQTGFNYLRAFFFEKKKQNKFQHVCSQKNGSVQLCINAIFMHYVL